MSEQPTLTQHHHPGSRRGIWTIAAIFALGLIVLAGLYLSPRSISPTVPAGVVSGVPDQVIRGVLLDCRPLGASPDRVIAAVRELASAPDLLLLVDIESSLVPAVVEAFAMQRSYHAELYQRAQPSLAGGGRIGVCILSPHGLFQASPVRVDRRVIGVETIMVIDGKSMHVRCLALDDAVALPPIVTHPKALEGGPPPVLLSGGRVRGQWVLTLDGVAAATAGGEWLVETRREAGPVGVAFKVGRQADAEATTGPGPAPPATSTPAVSRPAPATGRVE